MSNKYSGTLFDSSKTVFSIPVKKSESRNYFFRVPVQSIGYIPVKTFLFLLGYYTFLGGMWLSLYQQHFIAVSLITILNVTLSTVVVFRHKTSGKNMFDILKVLWEYIKGNKIYLLKPYKKDLASLYQQESLNIKTSNIS